MYQSLWEVFPILCNRLVLAFLLFIHPPPLTNPLLDSYYHHILTWQPGLYHTLPVLTPPLGKICPFAHSTLYIAVTFVPTLILGNIFEFNLQGKLCRSISIVAITVQAWRHSTLSLQRPKLSELMEQPVYTGFVNYYCKKN